MKTEHLTARQSEVLALIRSYITDTGYPPTRADIAAELGFKSISLNQMFKSCEINDEVTVKRFKQGKSKTELVFLPENEDFEPIIVGLNKDTVVIEGKSVGVMRLH